MAELSQDCGHRGPSRPGDVLTTWWGGTASQLHGEMGSSQHGAGGRTTGLSPSRRPQQLTSAYAELMKQFLLSHLQEGCFFSPQLGIQLAAVFMHKAPELARVRRGPALPRSPNVLGEITQFIFSGCRMPFPLHSSSLRYLITMFPIHMSGHFLVSGLLN